MKLVLFVAFMASAACMISAKKLLVLNPGVGGLNPGVVSLNGGLLNPGLVGGLNPALTVGGGPFIGQPLIGQMIPAFPPFMLQPQMGIPNAPAQLPQQFPFQPNGGMPFLPPVNRQVMPPQLQAVGQMNPAGNGQLPQGDMPAGPVPRFRRALRWRLQDNSVTQVTSSPGTTEQPQE